MTSEEIGAATPWEIARRVAGYNERERLHRIFYANFVTVPIINAAGHPKHPITAQKIIPDDFHEYRAVNKVQEKHLLNLMEQTEQERRLKDG